MKTTQNLASVLVSGVDPAVEGLEGGFDQITRLIFTSVVKFLLGERDKKKQVFIRMRRCGKERLYFAAGCRRRPGIR